MSEEADPRDPAVARAIRARYERALAYLRDGFGWDFVDRVNIGNTEQTRPAAIRGQNLEWHTEGALDFLKQNHARPFFLYYPLPVPHGQYHNLRKLNPLATAAGMLEKAPASQPSRESIYRRLKEAGIDERNAMATWMDDAVGAVLKALDDYKVAGNTMVLFISDNPSRGKNSCYEGARVPALVRWPGRVEAGSRVNTLCGNIDVGATLVEAAGGAAPADMRLDGRSFLPQLTGHPEPADWRREILLEVNNSRAAVGRRWKYIANRAQPGGRGARARAQGGLERRGPSQLLRRNGLSRLLRRRSALRPGRRSLRAPQPGRLGERSAGGDEEAPGRAARAAAASFRGVQKMTATPRTRIAIVGAGAVGSTIAYAVMMRGLAHEIVLVDAVPGKAEAEAKDLLHGSMFVPPVELLAGSVEDCRGAAVVVVTAGAKQKPGQTRLELVEHNAALFRGLVPRILAAAPEALLLVVSNPVDVLTYISLRLSGLPPARVFGSGTVLDTSRFRALLAAPAESGGGERARVDRGRARRERSAGVVERACGRRAPRRVRAHGRDRAEIFAGVRGAAAEVIAAKGATNWAIGLAVERILQAVLRDENAVLPVSALVSDYHGIDGVCLSVPRLLTRGGAGAPLPVPYNESELAQLRRSAEILRATASRAGF